MATNDNKIEIEIVLDDGTIKKGFAKVEAEAQSSGSKIGKAFGGNVFGGLGKALTGLGAQIAIVGSAFIAAFASKKVIDAAVEQQNAINALNSSLRTAGTFSQAASSDFQRFAAELQKVTTISDDAILTNAALARNFTKTNEEAKKLTEAAVNLSAATGISLESAVKNLGKTYAGLAGELGESIPTIRTLTQEQLKSGAAIDLVANRFGGAATDKLNTFSGALESLKNRNQDFLVSIGNLIIKSPVVVELFKLMAKSFNGLSDTIKQLSDKDAFGQLIISAFKFAQTVNLTLTPAFTFFYNTAISSIKGIGQGLFILTNTVTMFGQAYLEKFIVPVNEGAAAVERFIGKISGGIIGGEKFAKQIEADTLASVKFQEQLNNLNGSMSELATLSTTISESLTLPDFTEQIDATLQSYTTSLENAKAVTDEIQSTAQNATQEQLLRTTDFMGFLTNVATGFTSRMKESAKELAILTKTGGEKLEDLKKKVLENDAAIAQSLRDTFVAGTSNAIAGFAGALVKGENAMAALGKGVLGVFGDILVQLGTQLLAVGLAMSTVPILFGFQGPAALAAGAAFLLAGGALKALAGMGGGGGGGASGSVAPATGEGIGDVGTGLSEQVTDLETLGATSVGGQLVVNVNGNILDRKETGLELAEIIRESFGEQGVVFNA